MRLEQLPDVHSGRNAERVQDDVDGRAVGEERHVLDREDLGDDALVAVTAGELVALLDLALLRHVHADELVDARRQIVAVRRGENVRDRDDAAGLAVRHLERRVAHLAGLLAEDGAQEALLGGELGLALRRDLADQNVAREHLGADADDAVLVEIGQHVLADVGDLAGDLFRSELGVASLDLVLLDVDRGEEVFLDDALGEDDRVLVVVALPRHERDEEVLAQAPARPISVDGPSASTSPAATFMPSARAGVWLMQVPWLERMNLGRWYSSSEPSAARTAIVRAVDGLDGARTLGGDDLAGVDGGAVLHAGADERGASGAAAERPGAACSNP